MFINDVGQNTWEEINDGIAGANYGWPTTEGRRATRDPSFGPLFAYGHGVGPDGCAITGGAFYRAATALFPAISWVTTSSPISAAAGSIGSIPASGYAFSTFASGLDSAGRPAGRT